MRSLPIILTALLVIVSDPYKDIKYDQINIYEYDTKCHDDCIGYTESEGWSEADEEAEEELAKSDEITTEQIIEVARHIILLSQPVVQ